MDIVRILRDITQVLPQDDRGQDKGFIAGGAVRDVDHHLMPKDVDIFFDLTHPTTRPVMYQDWLPVVLPQLQRHTFRDLTGNTDYDENLTQIEAVYEWKWREDEGGETIPVQAIFRRSPEVKSSRDTLNDLLRTFDLDVCRTGLLKQDGLITVVQDGVYRDAKRDRWVFNLNNNSTTLTTAQQNKTRERAIRIANKLGYVQAVQFTHPATDAVEVEAARLVAIETANRRRIQWQAFGQQLVNHQVYLPLVMNNNYILDGLDDLTRIR